MKIAENYSRLGTENAFVILAKAKKLESEGKEIINLGIGQPDFLTPKHIVEAAKKALDEGHHGYTPANGTIELREGVSRHIKKCMEQILKLIGYLLHLVVNHQYFLQSCYLANLVLKLFTLNLDFQFMNL